MSHPQVIFGTGLFGRYEGSVFSNGEKAQGLIDTLRNNGISRIDTARRYPAQNSGTSEAVLGECDLQGFTVDTKVWSMPGRHRPEELSKSLQESLDTLGVEKVNCLYLHFPDTETPLEEMLKGMTDLHKEGKFNEFGVSNFTIPQLKEMLALSESKGYIKPAAYQGQYNAIARDAEKELLPFLREHGIAFIAFSPTAGGAFNKDSTRLIMDGPAGDQWRRDYGHEGAIAGMQKVRDAAEKHGLTGHAVALRWTLYHSALRADGEDAIIITARVLEQLQPNLDICEAGPLPGDLVTSMDELWTVIQVKSS